MYFFLICQVLWTIVMRYGWYWHESVFPLSLNIFAHSLKYRIAWFFFILQLIRCLFDNFSVVYRFKVLRDVFECTKYLFPLFYNHLRNPLVSSQWRRTRETPPLTTLIIYWRTGEKLREGQVSSRTFTDCGTSSRGLLQKREERRVRTLLPRFSQPIVRPSRNPSSDRRSHCAYPIVLNLQERIYSPPHSRFPFSFCVAFPSFSHTAARAIMRVRGRIGWNVHGRTNLYHAYAI